MTDNSPKPIVVGLDGSKGSGEALAWAARLARDLGAELILVNSFEPPVYPASEPGGMAMDLSFAYDKWRAELKRGLEGEWSAPVRDMGLKYRTVMWDGSPANALMDVAGMHDALMIVVGSRGLSRIAKMVLGSVSNRLVNESHHPVVVVPESSSKAPSSEPSKVSAARTTSKS